MARAGAISERLWIERRTVSASTEGTGAPVETWAAYHQTRADVQTPRGRERFVEQRETNVARRVFVIRYNPTTRPLVEAGGSGEYRVRFPSSDSEPWDLEDAVDVEGRRVDIELSCRRVF